MVSGESRRTHPMCRRLDSIRAAAEGAFLCPLAALSQSVRAARVGRGPRGKVRGDPVMNSGGIAPLFDPSHSHLERLVLICERFEATWREGGRPRISDFLGDLREPLRTAALRELLALDLRLRHEVGERPAPEDYRGEFP